MNDDVLSGKPLGAAIRVHRFLGPGLLESVYEETPIDADLRFDLLVEDRLRVELKCGETLAPIHKAQVLTYLRLLKLRVGLLLNFLVPVLREGHGRRVHGYAASVSPSIGA